jgi:hypothetical protein
LLLAVVAGAGLLAVHGAGERGQLLRAADFDEAQYLHGAWLLANGKRLYQDFAEDHTPFLEHGLRLLLPAPPAAPPAFPRLDVPRFLARGRIFMAIVGTLAALLAALTAWRLAGRPAAPVIAFAALAGSGWTWQRAMADLRNDPPALLLFWAGLLAILWRRDGSRAAALRAGAGVGLVAVAALWNPKWPLASAAAGLFAAAGLLRGGGRAAVGRLLWAALPALAIAGGAVLLLLRLCRPGDYLFFSFTFNAGLMDWFRHSPLVNTVWFGHKPTFYYAPALFRGPWPLLAGVICAAALALPRAARALPDRRALALVLALVLACYLEIRLVYPFPNLWPQHYLLWAFANAVVYACVPAAALALGGALSVAQSGRRPPLAPLVDAIAIAAAGVLFVVAARPRLVAPSAGRYWNTVSWVQRQLRPGDQVWLPPDVHPVGAVDASYYWFSFVDLVPYALAWHAAHPSDSRLPAAGDADLPPCRLEQGLEPNLRYLTTDSSLVDLPASRTCLHRLLASRRLSPAGVPGVLEVVTPEEREP